MSAPSALPDPCLSSRLGTRHTLALHEHVELVALADPHPASRAFGRKTSAREIGKYADARSMLDRERLDAVFTASPNFTHAAILEEVLPRPLQVLVEKPLCTSLEDCDQVVDS